VAKLRNEHNGELKDYPLRRALYSFCIVDITKRKELNKKAVDGENGKTL
jgi:hypothetical protein